MKDYVAKIDGGEGGETVIRAGSAAKALAQAIEWARGGEWDRDGGIHVDVAVVAKDDDSDTASDTIYVPTYEEEIGLRGLRIAWAGSHASGMMVAFMWT